MIQTPKMKTLAEILDNAIRMNWSQEAIDLIIRAYAEEATKEE